MLIGKDKLEAEICPMIYNNFVKEYLNERTKP